MRCKVSNKCLMYFSHNLIGGFPSSISHRLKYAWLSSLLFVALFHLIGAAGYFATAASLTVSNMALSICTTSSSAGCGFAIGISIITRYYYRAFEELFRYIEDRSTSSVSYDITHHRHAADQRFDCGVCTFIERNNSAKTILVWLLVLAICPTLVSGLLIVDVVFLAHENETMYRDMEHHLMTVPLINYIPNLRVYWAVFMCECVALHFVAILTGFPIVFMITISIELKNIVVAYCERMQNFTESLVTRIENNTNERTSLLAIERDLKIFIRDYKELLRIVQLIRPFTQLYNMALLLGFVLTFVGNSFALFLADYELSMKLKRTLISMVCSVYLYTSWSFGSVFDDMNEAVIYQVYNLPWIYFPPSLRKTVGIFLTHVQRPIAFKTFKIYPISLRTFPAVFRMAYSFIHVLAALVRR